MKRANHLFLLMIVLLMPAMAQAARKPAWVKQRPNDPKHYIGIGIVNKINGETTYTTHARNQAMRELCSEIKVSIASNSILRQFENNYELKEAFESNIQTSVAETIEGYDVFTWEDKSQYWVMLKLSKDKYEMNRRLMLDKARRTALASIENARKSIAQHNINSAIANYINALQAIEKHIEDDLTIQTFEGNINLGTTLYQDIQTLFTQIAIVANQPRYVMPFSQQLRNPVSVMASIKTNGEALPVVGLPIAFNLAKGSGDFTTQTVTDPGGTAFCNINGLQSKRRVQELVARLDLEALTLGSIKNQSLANLFFNPASVPQVTIMLEISKATAWFDSSETVFGQEQAPNFNNQIKSILSDNYFVFTTLRDEADYIVTLHTDFIKGDEKKGNGYSVFVVYGSYRLAIGDSHRQMEIFTDGIDRIVGMMPGDYSHSLKNCRDKLTDRFNQITLPKLDGVDM